MSHNDILFSEDEDNGYDPEPDSVDDEDGEEEGFTPPEDDPGDPDEVDRVEFGGISPREPREPGESHADWSERTRRGGVLDSGIPGTGEV